jgi:hypothetical protein
MSATTRRCRSALVALLRLGSIRRGSTLLAAAAAALVMGAALPVSAAPVAAATAVQTGLPGGGLVPIFCQAEASVSSTGAASTAVCTDTEDTFSYQWTWIDELTGALLAVSGGTVSNTASVSTASSTSGGTPGHRQATVCYTTAKAGYHTVTTCVPPLSHV